MFVCQHSNRLECLIVDIYRKKTDYIRFTNHFCPERLIDSNLTVLSCLSSDWSVCVNVPLKIIFCLIILPGGYLDFVRRGLVGVIRLLSQLFSFTQHLISVRHGLTRLTITLWRLWHAHLSHHALCQTYKVITDSTSFIWMGVCNASLHPLEIVKSVLFELMYLVI